MKNSSTRKVKQPQLMSIFYTTIIKQIHKQFPQSTIYHYMDAILFANSDTDILGKTYLMK